MGKNQQYKAAQRAKSMSRGGGGGGGDEESNDGMIDGSFHSPAWHAARLAALQTTNTLTWEEWKAQRKEEARKQQEMEGFEEQRMKEYRAHKRKKGGSESDSSNSSSGDEDSDKKKKKKKSKKDSDALSSASEEEEGPVRLSSFLEKGDDDLPGSDDEDEPLPAKSKEKGGDLSSILAEAKRRAEIGAHMVAEVKKAEMIQSGLPS
ncbi:unnamed protein product [Closterium sp. Naga37s-1]|nr:unnamed protein product [Closterium sp. Naga37s-1]